MGSLSSALPRLNVVDGSFKGNAYTAALLLEVGAERVCVPAARAASAMFPSLLCPCRLTPALTPLLSHSAVALFYQRMFRDSRISQFVASEQDPHAQRLSNWICEKMGGVGTPWSDERRVRSVCPVALGGGQGMHHVVDRSSAHMAAWWCVKRSDEVMGRRFKLPDARTWMRLMFWSCREAGLFSSSPEFQHFFVCFIAHFVAVYERSAPAYAEESLRWSEGVAGEARVAAYLAEGHAMVDLRE